MITTRQRERRLLGIGASDVPKILGISPWGGPWDVWAEKVGLIPHGELPACSRMRARIGELTEDAQATLLSEEIGLPIVRPTATYVEGCLRVNVDRQVEKAARGYPVVECKNTGYLEGWGDAVLGARGIPPDVNAQVQTQILVVGAAFAYVTLLAADRGQEFRIYRVERNEPLCRNIFEVVSLWYEKYVVGVVEPDRDAQPPTIETLRRLPRVEGKVVTLAPSLIEEYVRENEAENAAASRKDAVKRRIAAFLGDAEKGECSLGSATFKGTTSIRFDEEAFKAAHPGLWAEFATERTTERSLRVYPKKPKAFPLAKGTS